MTTKPSDFMARLGREITTKAGVRAVFNKKALDEIGALTVREMKASIARGMSPLDGYGRFDAYLNPERYPGKRKPARPVNLFLMGDMLGALKFRINQATLAITVFYATRKAQLKELGHREGANGQPIRPTIPDEGEFLSPAIRRKVQSLINNIVRQASLTWKS